MNQSKTVRLVFAVSVFLLFVTGVSADIFDGYEDGVITDTWDKNPNFPESIGATESPVYNGQYAAQFGDAGRTNVWAAEWDLGQTQNFTSVEYYWQETRYSFGQGVTFRNSDNNIVLGLTSNNPTWQTYDDSGFTDIYSTGDYYRWIRYNVTFDWGAGTYNYEFEDMPSGHVETGSGNLRYSGGIRYIRTHPYNNGNFSHGSDTDGSLRLTIDDFEISEAPVDLSINSLECELNDNQWSSCDQSGFGDDITRLRANITGDNLQYANFSLADEYDNNIRVSSFNYTSTSGDYFVADIPDQVIDDSGGWNASVTASNSGGSDSLSQSWSVAWGSFSSQLDIPGSSIDVLKNEEFNVTADISCSGGECSSENESVSVFAESQSNGFIPSCSSTPFCVDTGSYNQPQQFNGQFKDGDVFTGSWMVNATGSTGDYSVYVGGNSSNGNIADTSTASETVTITKENPPNVTNVDVEPSGVVGLGNTVNISADVVDDVEDSYSVDSVNVTVRDNGSNIVSQGEMVNDTGDFSRWYKEVTLSGGSLDKLGRYSIEVSANDTGGNSASNSSVETFEFEGFEDGDVTGWTGDTGNFTVNQRPSYDVSKISYSGSNINVTSDVEAPTGVTWNSDGSKLFVLDGGNSSVHEYSLDDAYNLRTAQYTGNSYNLSDEMSSPRGFAWNDDGSKMFVSTGLSTGYVYEYSISTNFDVTTASYTQNYQLDNGVGAPRGIDWNSDGTKMFIASSYPDDYVHQYSLSTAYDVSSASYSKGYNVSTEETIPEGLAWNNDGTSMYLVGTSSNNVHQYSLSTAYDVGSASYTNSNIDVNSELESPTDIIWNGDGTEMFVTGYNYDTYNDFVYSYSGGNVLNGTYSGNLTTWIGSGGSGTVSVSKTFEPGNNITGKIYNIYFTSGLNTWGRFEFRFLDNNSNEVGSLIFSERTVSDTDYGVFPVYWQAPGDSLDNQDVYNNDSRIGYYSYDKVHDFSVAVDGYTDSVRVSVNSSNSRVFDSGSTNGLVETVELTKHASTNDALVDPPSDNTGIVDDLRVTDSNLTGVDFVPPQTGNLTDNVTGFVSGGRPVNLSARIGDAGSGLERAWLATNETDSFYNYTGLPAKDDFEDGRFTVYPGDVNNPEGASWGLESEQGGDVNVSSQLTAYKGSNVLRYITDGDGDSNEVLADTTDLNRIEPGKEYSTWVRSNMSSGSSDDWRYAGYESAFVYGDRDSDYVEIGFGSGQSTEYGGVYYNGDSVGNTKFYGDMQPQQWYRVGFVSNGTHKNFRIYDTTDTLLNDTGYVDASSADNYGRVGIYSTDNALYDYDTSTNVNSTYTFFYDLVTYNTSTTHGSPESYSGEVYGGSGVRTLQSFVWSNSSIDNKFIGYRVWAEDLAGNVNSTDVNIFEVRSVFSRNASDSSEGRAVIDRVFGVDRDSRDAGVVDSFVGLFRDYSRSGSISIGTDSSVDRGVDVGRSVVETFNLEEVVDRTGYWFRDVSEGQSVEGNASRTSLPVRTIQASLNTASSVFRSEGFVRQGNSSFTVSDVVERGLNGFRDVTGRAESGTSVERNIEVGRTASQVIDVYGRMAATALYPQTVSQQFSLDTAIQTDAVSIVNVGDSAGTDSSVSRSIDVGRSISQPVKGVADAVRNAVFTREVSDSSRLNTSTFRGRLFISEVAAAFDTGSSVDRTGDVVRRSAESSNLAFVSDRTLYVNRTALQSSLVSSVVDRDLTVFRDAEDSASVDSSVDRSTGLVRTAVSDYVVQSGVSRTSDLVRQVAVTGMVDLFVDRDAGFNRSVGQQVNVSDSSSVARLLGRSVVDSALTGTSVDRTTGLVRSVAGSTVFDSNVAKTQNFVRNIQQDVSVESGVDRSVSFFRNVFTEVQVLLGLESNVKPTVDSVRLNVDSLGDKNNVSLRVNVSDGNADLDSVRFNGVVGTVSGSSDSVVLDVPDQLTDTRRIVVNDSFNYTDSYELGYNVTDSGWVQDETGFNLSYQKINKSDVVEETAGNPLYVSVSHEDFNQSTVSGGSFDLFLKGNQSEVVSVFEGDFLEEVKQWHTRSDGYNTVYNQSIAQTLNVSNNVPGLAWRDINTSTTSVPSPFQPCNTCGSKLINVTSSKYSNLQEWTDTGDGVTDEFVQDISDVVIGERSEWWSQYRYFNTTTEVRFTDVWANTSIDDNETDYGGFVRPLVGNTYNNTLIPESNSACNTVNPEVNTTEFGGETWSACMTSLDGDSKPDYFNVKIPVLSQLRQVRFGGFKGVKPPEGFQYNLGDPCPDSIEGDSVGPNSSYVCYRNQVMEPEETNLDTIDVSGVVGVGGAAIASFFIIVVLAAVLFYRDEEEDNSIQSASPGDVF